MLNISLVWRCTGRVSRLCGVPCWCATDRLSFSSARVRTGHPRRGGDVRLSCVASGTTSCVAPASHTTPRVPTTTHSFLGAGPTPTQPTATYTVWLHTELMDSRHTHTPSANLASERDSCHLVVFTPDTGVLTVHI